MQTIVFGMSGTLRSRVKSRYLKVDSLPKLLISQSKCSGPRKFTLRYQ